MTNNDEKDVLTNDNTEDNQPVGPVIPAAQDAGLEPPPEKEKKYSRFNLKNEVMILLFSLASAFTVCFFSPVETYLGNQHEFLVSSGHIVVPMLLTALAGTAAIAVIMNIFLLINEKLFKVVSCLGAGCLLAMYCQMLFLNGSMVTITGDSNDYSEKNSDHIMNLITFIIIMLTPLIMFIIARGLSVKPEKSFISKLIAFLSAAIFAMQGVGMFSRVASTGLKTIGSEEYQTFMDYRKALDLSEKGNVLVFLTDRLDGVWFEELLNYYPELRTQDYLDGFTFYKNNVSQYTNTFPSVPEMLTADHYEGQDWADYLEEGWAGETLPRKLHDNGYKVGLILDNNTTFNYFSDLADQCDNLSTVDQYAKLNYLGKGGIVRTLADFSLGKLSPYLLKNKFLSGYTSDFSNSFLSVEEQLPERMEGAVGNDSDKKFYEYVRDFGITADSHKKTFSFIHLNFAHDWSDFMTGLVPDNTTPANTYTTSRGGFETLKLIFDQMKELGIYDDTTIIILGDHGRPPYEIELHGALELESAITTSLLIKPANAEHGELKTDSTSELSNAYFAASVLEYAGIDHSDFGYSYNDVIAMGDEAPERDLKVYFWHGIGRIEEIVSYAITGDAKEFENWKITSQKKAESSKAKKSK